MSSTILAKVADELGWFTIVKSSRDTKILCAQRFVRMFAYGSSTLVLALFLAEIGITVARIGLFMTLTLLGDVLLSFFLTLFADGLGRRRVLTCGALLMVISGICFSLSSSWLILVLASVFGVISPSGAEIGPFRAIEESTLAQLTSKDSRSEVFAWYTLIGSAGAALGTLASGGIVQSLETRLGWSQVSAYRSVFVLYSIIGLLKTALTLMLSDACEAEPKEDVTYQELNQQPDSSAAPSAEGRDANGEDGEGSNKHGTIQGGQSLLSRLVSILPKISSESRSILWKLCLLFGVDSFASGLVAASWLTYYFTTKFGIEADVLGTIFFVANLFASASGLVAASLAKRIGLIKTMVCTHLPSAIFLSMIPVPSHVGLAATLLFLRSSMASMDQAPRQAFLAAAVLPGERTAVMGVVNVIKTLAQSGGPTATGALAGNNKFWLVFLLAGGLKATYDLSMLWLFLGFKGREGGEG